MSAAIRPAIVATSVIRPIIRSIESKRVIPQFSIPEIDRNLFGLGARLIEHSPYSDYPRIVKTTQELFRDTMKKELRSHLRQISFQQADPFLLLRNCPGNPFPGVTPEEDRHSPEKGFTEEYFMFGLAGNLSLKPYCDPNEKSGEVVAQLLTMKGYEQHKSSRGSGDLVYHTEHIHTDHAVHYVILSCVKGDRGVVTKILPVDECVKGLPEWVIEELSQPHFQMASGASFNYKGIWKGMKIHRTAPILTPDPLGGYYIQYHGNSQERLVPLTPKAKEALEVFTKKIEETDPYEVCLEKWDTLVINGRKTIHAKKGGSSELSHSDRRWLLRLYAKVDYEALYHERCNSFPKGQKV